VQIFSVDDLVAANVNQRTLPLPSGRYCGFAIGPSSHHDTITLRCSKGRIPIVAGSPVALDLQEGEQPELIATRFGVAYGEIFVAESSCELAALPRRRAAYQSLNAAVAATVGYSTLLTIPFSGRRRAAIYLEAVDGAIDYKVLGRLYYTSSAYHENTLVAEATLVFGASTFIVVGGTDNAEDYDVLILQAKYDEDPCTHRAQARAWGELSD
jgi:hypothetical protein